MNLKNLFTKKRPLDLYLKGKDAEAQKGFTKAVKYFKLAANQGIPEVEYNLAILYSHEEFNIKEDKKLAWIYLNQAAKWVRKKHRNF